MKSIISLIFSGLILCGSLTAQNYTRKDKVLDQIDILSNAVAENNATYASTLEQTIMESLENDFSTSIWSRDIYRQINKDVIGNESFFFPVKSKEEDVNLFSLMINLISSNTVPIYKFNPQPNTSTEYKLEGGEALKECAIPYTENEDGSFKVKQSDIPTEEVTYYLIKEKWDFDSKTSKGEARVTHICPVLFERGKYFPLFWIALDDIGAYLSRVETSVSFNHVASALTNASMFDIIKGRYYRGCIYQVGLRQLSHHFSDMKELINERRRIENELDYIQSRFYAAQERR